MSWLVALVAFLVTIVVVVGVHEWGHYLAARMNGVRVMRFSIGFGKPIFSRTDRNGTEWVLAPIPLGGYVRMLENAEEADSIGCGADESLDAKPRWRRAIVVAAGPLANFVLAAVLFFVVALQGSEGLRARIGSTVPGSMAEQAGFLPGDEVTAIDGRKVVLWGEFFEEVFIAASDVDINVEVNSGGSRRTRYLPLSQLPPAAISSNLLEAVGFRSDTTYLTVELALVVPGSPAEAAGFRVGDMIVAVDGEVIEKWRRIVDLIEAAPGRPIDIVVLRDGKRETVTVTPEADAKQDGVGKIGVVPARDKEKLAKLVAKREHGVAESMGIALRRTVASLDVTFRFIGHLLGRRMSVDNLSGPVGIAGLAGTAASIGLVAYLVFLAHISISLGALNLLPIPLLDGGHLLQYAIEGALRRPLPEMVVGFARIVGVILIVCLMALALYSDLT